MVFAESSEGRFHMCVQGTQGKAISIRLDSRKVCAGDGFPRVQCLSWVLKEWELVDVGRKGCRGRGMNFGRDGMYRGNISHGGKCPG